MKPLQLLLLCVLMSFYSHAQIVDIPDLNFKAALIAEGVDTNADGEIQESEAMDETYLNLYNYNISDLTGILSFINLGHLDCSNNQLTSLDVSGLGLLYQLECYENQLTSLNFSNCPNIDTVVCDHNSLESLDFTGIDNMDHIGCDFNNISSIVFPSGFEIGSIIANENQIVDLDLSNIASIYNGLFINNSIETINIKNGIDDFSDISVNLFDVQFICADENELEDIRDYWEVIDFGVIVSSYCTFEPGGDYNRITGSVRLDLESDGCDAMDAVLPNILIEINDGIDQGFTSTNQFGDYNAYVAIGNYSLTPNIENPNWFTSNPIVSNISFVDYNNLSVQDFCIKPVGLHQDVEVLIVPIIPAQPGFDAKYQIVYKNKGNQIVSGDIGLTYDETVLDFISSSVGIASQTAGSLVWNYADLNPFESRSITVTLNVNSPMETPAVNIGDQLGFLATINPITGDETPNDNTINFQQTVVGSFDPNDITCLEGNIVSPEKIGEYLHYNINFENTGTAAATFVVVKDVIDETNYDLSSLQIMYASHPMQTRVIDNKMEFIFDNINLGPNEKGNVVFKIKTENSLTVGDSVENKAEIFFDFNFPIETNTATTTFNTLSVEDFEIENLVSVYPNPVSDLLFINSKRTIEKLELFDVRGRVIQKLNIIETHTVDVSSLNKGIYFLRIKTAIGVHTQKVIKK